MKRLAILGEIGTGNLGDDFGFALLRAELQAAFAELGVPVEVVYSQPVFQYDSRSGFDAVVTGCGTLLDEVGWHYVEALARCSQSMPTAILGTGTADPRMAPPTEKGRVMLAEALRRAAYVWRRGENGPDTGWLFGWHGAQGQDNLVGLNYGPAVHNVLHLDVPALLRVRTQLRRPHVLVAAFRDDLPHLRPLMGPREGWLHVDGTPANFAHLARLSTCFCLRIHLGVFSACCGCHPILLDYTGKVRKAFAATDVPVTILDAEHATPDHIVAALHAGGPVSREAVEKAQTECKTHVRLAASAIVRAWR